MDIRKQREIFRRYLRGTASPDEKVWVEAWYAAFDVPERQDVVPEPVDDVKEYISQQITRSLNARRRTYRLWRWGAAACLIAGIGISTYLFVFQQSVRMIYTVVSTDANERRMLYLADSTQLWLNAGTEIRYLPQSYGKKKREIWLQKGEVFLEVTPNKRVPLLVYWDDLEVKVLGTAFNVHVQQQVLEVGVRKGKVAVHRGGQPLGVLTRGTQLQYDRAKAVAYKYHHPTNRIAIWQMDKLALENASFTELRKALIDFYGIVIEAGSPLVSELRFTMELERAATSKQTLEVVCAIHELKLRKEVDGTVTLYK